MAVGLCITQGREMGLWPATDGFPGVSLNGVIKTIGTMVDANGLKVCDEAYSTRLRARVGIPIKGPLRDVAGNWKELLQVGLSLEPFPTVEQKSNR